MVRPPQFQTPMKRSVRQILETPNFDSAVRIHKRSRLTHKAFHGDTRLITPFLKYKDTLGDVVIPSLSVQNLIAEHFDRQDRLFGPGRHHKAKLIEQHGHPFFQQECVICKTPHYTYMFACKDKRCSACRNVIDRNRHQIDYTPIQKAMIMDVVDDMLDEAWSVHGFNERRFRPQMERVVDGGHARLVNLVLDRGVTYQHVCKQCGEGFYLFDAHIDPKTKLGIRPCCKPCTTTRRNQANMKGIHMNRRFTGDVDGYAIIQNRLAIQNRLCHYTFMPMNATKSSPWMYSPERLDRDKSYADDGNVVLCCEVFNVGGAINFSHKLVLQMFFANSFPVFYGWLNPVPIKWIGKRVSAAKQRCKTRKQRARRHDRSFEFDIDKQYMADLAKAQGYRCAISGIPLVFQTHHPWLASVDRIDPAGGYTRGNVRWVIFRFNSRHTWTDDMVNTLMSTLDKTIHKVWTAYWGQDGPSYGQYILNLSECPPDTRSK